MDRSAKTGRRKAHNIRYDDHEWDRIVVHARQCGIPPCTFVRKVSLGAKPRARRNGIENELIHRLAEIGTDLRRLAQLAQKSADAYASANLRRVLDEALAAIRRVG